MKTERFAHINALCSDIACSHQELGFLTPPERHSSGAKVDPEHPNLIEQSSSDRKTRTEWRRFSWFEEPGLPAVVEPDRPPRPPTATVLPPATRASLGPSPAESNSRQSNRPLGTY